MNDSASNHDASSSDDELELEPALSELFDRPDATSGYLQRAQKDEARDRPEASPPPRYPFLLGVFEYPWRPSTLAAWIPMSLALLGATLIFGFWLIYGASAGIMGVRALAPAAFMAATLTSAYVSACCLKAIRDTAAGADSPEDWPAALEWKEWAWSFFYVGTILFESALVAFALSFWSYFLYWIPTALAIYAIFPVFLLSALEADAWAPLSRPVAESLKTHAWAWGLFYLESLGVAVVWVLVTLAGAFAMGFWVVFLACPLAAAGLLIYARLLGRVAWCVAE